MEPRGMLSIVLITALACALMAGCDTAAPEQEAAQIEVLAATTAATEDDASVFVKPAGRENRRDTFSQLVEEGVISQETCDKMKEYMKKALDESGGRIKKHMEAISPETTNPSGNDRSSGLLEKLLEKGIITQSEYDALKDAIQNPTKLKPQTPGDRTSSDNPFSRFVDESIISEETAAAIKEYMKSERAGFPERPENMRPKSPIDLLGDMLESGVITQDEYDAVKAALPERTDVQSRTQNDIRVKTQSRA